MPAASEPRPALDQRLAENLLDFERLDEAWPRGRTAIERDGIGRQREDALSGIVVERGPESAAIIIGKSDLAETPMEWDKIALALAGGMFVTIFPGATVVVHYDDDGAVSAILPATHVPDEILVGEVKHLRHPEWSFEIQVLSSDSPPTVTKLIFGLAA